MGFVYQRASTLLTHISIMVAVLTLIGSRLTTGARPRLHNWYFVFVVGETSCTLQSPWLSSDACATSALIPSSTRRASMRRYALHELGFRFSLIRLSNFSAIVVTVIFLRGNAAGSSSSLDPLPRTMKAGHGQCVRCNRRRLGRDGSCGNLSVGEERRRVLGLEHRICLMRCCSHGDTAPTQLRSRPRRERTGRRLNLPAA